MEELESYKAQRISLLKQMDRMEKENNSLKNTSK